MRVMCKKANDVAHSSLVGLFQATLQRHARTDCKQGRSVSSKENVLFPGPFEDEDRDGEEMAQEIEQSS